MSRSTPAVRRRRRAVAAVVGGAVLLILTVAVLSPSSTPSAAASPPADGVGAHGVGITVEHLVDHSRATPANGPGHPAHAGRTLVTTILYPSTGPATGRPVRNADPDGTDGTYPLIVFAHGFGSDLSGYLPLLERWASAGFVVAAPLFPLTNAAAPGGPDLSDYVHQPGDMSFVVTQMVKQSASSSGPLSDLIDPSEIGAAGHSLGGVTTLGLVANSCCRDRRIKASVVMSGDPITFPGGRVEDGQAPPLLLVHGNADPTVPYVSSVDVFNQARAPKGLLTVVGGNHDSPVNATGPAFSSVVAATTDFFDRYLKGQTAALTRLRHDARPGRTTLTFVARGGADVRLPVPTTVVGHLQATVSTTTGLHGGQTVTVSWQGYAPGVSLNVLECSTNPPTVATDCDLTHAAILHPDPTGTGSLTFTVITGTVGSGTCDAAHPGCALVVNEGGSLNPSATVVTPISFSS